MWGNCPFYCDLIWQPKTDGVQELSVIPTSISSSLDVAQPLARNNQSLSW